MFIVRIAMLLALITLFSGCGDFLDDLNPAGVDSGSTGTLTTASDITISDSLGNAVTVPPVSGPIVLYFTMWCPVCDMHMSHMLSSIVPDFPSVTFYLVDYVSSSVSQVRTYEVSNGYSGTAFTTLADVNNLLENYYDGTMGTTVAIDGSKLIRMNEDYKDGSRLRSILTEITTP